MDKPENSSPQPEGDLPVKREESWDAVVERATRSGQGELAPARRSAEAEVTDQRWPMILKAAFPILIILFYITYKIVDNREWFSSNNDFYSMPDKPNTLTGVKPAEADFARVDRDKELKTFVERLEAMATRNEWAGVVTAIKTQKNQAITEHPVVRGLEALGRTRSGEFNIEVERRLLEAQANLKPQGNTYATLVRELEVAIANQILDRSKDSESLSRNVDNLFRLLGPESESEYETKVRQGMARSFEDAGDRLMDQAKASWRIDRQVVLQARLLYQTGLRAVVSAKGWKERRMITPGTGADVERLTEKIREANRSIHGMALPFTGADSSTWTGKADSPPHDTPN